MKDVWEAPVSPSNLCYLAWIKQVTHISVYGSILYRRPDLKETNELFVYPLLAVLTSVYKTWVNRFGCCYLSLTTLIKIICLRKAQHVFVASSLSIYFEHVFKAPNPPMKHH